MNRKSGKKIGVTIAVLIIVIGLGAAVGLDAVLVSCSALPGSTTAEVTIALPPWPADHPPLIGWTVETPDGTAALTAADRSYSVTVSKNRAYPVLAFPITAAGRFFAPAGTVYPASTDATWVGGFAAKIARDLSAASPDGDAFCDRINWGRFFTETAAFDNPYHLDRAAIVTKLAAGTFTKTTLKIAAKPVTLTVAPGTYYEIYVPVAPTVVAESTGTDDDATDDDSATTDDTATLDFAYTPGLPNRLLVSANTSEIFAVVNSASVYHLAHVPASGVY
jgi:hypothetical protein